MNKRALLIILDGFGEGKDYEGNALTRSKMPVMKQLRAEYPMTFLRACGNVVGVPEGTQGGSEVGHFTMGAGRQVFQTLEEINQSIKSGDFFNLPMFVEGMERVKKNPKATLHIIGMVSDQGVHSDVSHLLALLQMAKQQGIKECVIHAITDGRDVRMKSACHYIEMVEREIIRLGMEGHYRIATVIGRYYAMDRDSNWDRLQVAYDLLTESKGIQEKSPTEGITHAYENGVESDYYIKPIVIESKPITTDDSVIFFNFRTDRARQLTWAFTGEKDDVIKLTQPAEKRVRPFFACMGGYSKIAPVAFATPVVKNNFGQVISDSGLKQFRIAETEKYAHVTYFFNSQVEKPFPLEDRLMIDSPKCPSYAEMPEMSAEKITEKLVEKLNEESYPVIVCNFANLDLVGHSGNLAGAIKAAETIDACLGRIIPAAAAHGYSVAITGDHGNAEMMLYEDGSPCPSHTKNPVPFILCDERFKNQPNKDSILRAGGALYDVAPTMLALLQIPQPVEMTGTSLINIL